MARSRLVGLALVVVVSLLGTATAAAAPKGELVNKEGKALVKNKFTGSLGETVLESTGGSKITCSSGSATGAQTSASAGEQTVTFSGCQSGGNKCKGGGGAAGSLVIVFHLSTLPGVSSMWLTYLVISLSFECGTTKGKLQGGFLVPVPLENKLAKEFTFTASQSKGIQEPTEYENQSKEKVKHVLEMEIGGKGLEQTGANGKETFAFEEEAEFR